MTSIAPSVQTDLPFGAFATPVSDNKSPLDPERAELREVSQQFEAIFLRRMLSSARAADFGGEKLIGGEGLEQFEQMRDEQVADIAAASGTFGLAEALEKQLAAVAQMSASSDSKGGF